MRSPHGGYEADGKIEDLGNPPDDRGIGVPEEPFDQGWSDEELAELTDRPPTRMDSTHPDPVALRIIDETELLGLQDRARAYARHPSASGREKAAYLELASAIEGVLTLDGE